MRLNFESPRNGWLPVIIDFAGTRFEFIASNVASDVISTLIDISNWLASIDTQSQETAKFERRTVHFWREPRWNTLTFDRVDGSENIAVAYFHEHDSASALQATPEDLLVLIPQCSRQFHRTQLVETISGAVEDLLLTTSVYDYYNHWGHRLDDDRFSALSRLLTNRV